MLLLLPLEELFLEQNIIIVLELEFLDLNPTHSYLTYARQTFKLYICKYMYMCVYIYIHTHTLVFDSHNNPIKYILVLSPFSSEEAEAWKD